MFYCVTLLLFRQKPKTDIAMEVAEEAQRLLPVGIETVHGVQADAQRVRLETIKVRHAEK